MFIESMSLIRPDWLKMKIPSGSFSPTLGKAIGYCFVPVEYSLERKIKIDIGGKFYDSKLTSTRFYKR